MEDIKKLTTKQLQRIEKKRKKMAAFLEIAQLNDKDREIKLQAFRQAIKSAESERSADSDSDEKSVQEKPTNNISNDKHISDDCNDKCIEASTMNEIQEENGESDEVPNKKPRLIGEDYIRLKQRLKERKKILQKIPRLRLTLVGEHASLNIKSDDRIPIFLSDIQHLFLYSIHGHHSSYSPTRWCHLEKYNRVTHTVVFIVEGLSLYHFMAYESMFSHITTNLEHRLEIVTPAAYGGSVIEDLAAVPITGAQSAKLLEEYGSFEAAIQHTTDVIKLLRTVFPVQESQVNDSFSNEESELPLSDKFPRTQLLLSLRQMIEENYPVPLRGELARKYGNYVMTKDNYLEATEKSPMYGLDCEMCRTVTGNLELARISIVDESLNIIYDSLVKPEDRIADYLTQYSGITKKMLKNVSTTLLDVQNHLKEILPADAILVGQSLNCDLHSLKMMHPYIIDTSVIFNITGDRYRKTKLQTLAREFLGEKIQVNRLGHCSAEDSKTSMKLTKLKLANSIDYGDAVLSGQCELKVLRMTPDKQKTRGFSFYKTELKKYATSIFKHIARNEKTAAVVGNKQIMNEYCKYLKATSLNIMDDKHFSNADQVRLVIADSNKHTVYRASEIAMEHAFTICHIKISEEELKDECVEKTFHNVNKWAKELWKGTAINGLTCVIFGGQNHASNGACFLNLKRELPAECVIRA